VEQMICNSIHRCRPVFKTILQPRCGGLIRRRLLDGFVGPRNPRKNEICKVRFHGKSATSLGIRRSSRHRQLRTFSSKYRV
jgi:hypothetical protein